jgi:hypothetical protein
MYYRPSQTSQTQMDSKNSFELHTWMIARFIETSETSGSSKSDKAPPHALTHYVVAACYPKMITRMEYRVSKAFRDALKPENLPKDFKFIPSDIGDAVGKLNDGRFIDFLSKYKRLNLVTSIENLVKHKNDLYNQETYTDFHKILSEILELFFKSLHGLKETHHNLKNKAPSSEQLVEIKTKINFIAMVGSGLRLLVKSRAIKRFLHNIARFLPDRAAGVDDDGDDDMDDDGDDDMDEEEDGLHSDDEGKDDELEGPGDGELDAVEQDDTMIKSHACWKSLNLGVVYIDAIWVLSKFVRTHKAISENFNISIKVLQQPCPKNSELMLSWKTLLQHETYFPGKPSPSAEEIVEFLEKFSGTRNQMSSQSTTVDQKSSKMGQKSKKNPVLTKSSPESVLMMLGALRRDIANDTFDTKIKDVTRSMETLQYISAGSAKHISRIVDKLNLLATGYLDIQDKTNEIDSVMKMVRTLADNTMLERMLQEGSPLDTGVGFKGVDHGEACIAAHCTFRDPKYFSPVSYFIIMFCSDLLILLVV